MNEDNGLWVNNKNQVVDIVADFLQNWLEDNISEKIYEEMQRTVSQLSTESEFDKSTIFTFESYINKRLESFIEQLNKLEVIE